MAMTEEEMKAFFEVDQEQPKSRPRGTRSSSRPQISAEAPAGADEAAKRALRESVLSARLASNLKSKPSMKEGLGQIAGSIVSMLDPKSEKIIENALKQRNISSMDDLLQREKDSPITAASLGIAPLPTQEMVGISPEPQPSAGLESAKKALEEAQRKYDELMKGSQ